jgi:hypothetical protein
MPPMLPTLILSGELEVPGPAVNAAARGVAASFAAASTFTVTGTIFVTPPWEMTTASLVGEPTVAEAKLTTTAQLVPAARTEVQVVVALLAGVALFALSGTVKRLMRGRA